MRNRMWNLVLGALLVLVGGCSVQSTQTDMLRQVLPGSGDFDPDAYAWVMRFNDTETMVYAVEVGDGIVFANREGLQIGFDGWDVVLVTGMSGALGDIRVIKGATLDGPRVHEVDGLGTFDLVCDEPISKDGGWSTACRYEDGDRVVRMTQRLDLLPDGRVARIEAHLIPGARPMILAPFES